VRCVDVSKTHYSSLAAQNSVNDRLQNRMCLAAQNNQHVVLYKLDFNKHCYFSTNMNHVLLFFSYRHIRNQVGNSTCMIFLIFDDHV
jgi:hypothetical protein